MFLLFLDFDFGLDSPLPLFSAVYHNISVFLGMKERAIFKTSFINGLSICLFIPYYSLLDAFNSLLDFAHKIPAVGSFCCSFPTFSSLLSYSVST